MAALATTTWSLGALASGGDGNARVASADKHSPMGGHDDGDDHGHGGGSVGHGGDPGHGGGGGPGGNTEGHSTLVGGAGNDTLVGVQGDVMQGGAGNDQFWLKGGAGDAGSTLQGGNGNDNFHVQTHHGNDTIIGGSGNDTASFADRSFFDVSKIDVDSSTSTYTLHFSDNQTVAVSGVEDLHFTDQVVNLPKL